MSLSTFLILTLASTTSSLSFSQPSANSTGADDALHNIAINSRITNSSASTRPSLPLNRRVSIDESCDDETVALLTGHMERIEVVARWAVQGAAFRSSNRGGNRGSGLGGIGRGRGRNPQFAENAFRRSFSRDQSRPQRDIPILIRSHVRRRFQLVVEQASQIRRPEDLDFRREQIYHCEREGDPNGVCRRGGYIKTDVGRYGVNVICPGFFSLIEHPVENESLIANQWLTLLESLLRGSWIMRQQNIAIIRNDAWGIHANSERYVGYAHALYYQPHGWRPPVT